MEMGSFMNHWKKCLSQRSYLMMLCIIFCLSGIGILIFGNRQILQASEINIKDSAKKGGYTLQTDDLKASIRLGYDGVTKVGKNMRVSANVKNSGNDFNGKLMIVYGTQDGIYENCMVQKDFYVLNGQMTKVQFCIPVVTDELKFYAALCDEDGDVLVSKHIPVEIDQTSSDVFIGILSEEDYDTASIERSLSLTGNSQSPASASGKIFKLKKSDISGDKAVLDTLDMIIVDRYDSDTLGLGQIKAIKKWVQSGGTLYIGGGNDAARNLSGFQKNLLHADIQKGKKVNSDLGLSSDDAVMLNESSDYGMYESTYHIILSEIQVEGAETILRDDSHTLIQSLDLSKGKIMVAGFSIFDAQKALARYGSSLMLAISNSFSSYKKNELDRGSDMLDMGYSYAYQNDVLHINEEDKLPNLRLYGVILIVYIVIAGPVLYYILKAKKKRMYLWIAVPFSAIVFSLIIYILGTSTRIQNPYLNYASYISLDDTGSKRQMTTMFGVSDSSNSPYSIHVRSAQNIVPIGTGHNTDMGFNEKGDNDFAYGVEYAENSTNLLMKNLHPFEMGQFLLKQEIKNDGDVDIEVGKYDDELSGKITNTLPYDLEDCILCYNQNFIYIKNIKSGEKISVDKISQDNIYSLQDYNSDDVEAIINSVMEGSLYDNSIDAGKRRKIGMLINYYYKDQTQNAWFYGFVKNGTNKSFTKMFDCDTYGITGVAKTVQMKETIGGYEVIGSLENYAYAYDNEYTNGTVAYYREEPSEFAVVYKMPDNFSLKELLYSKETAKGREFEMAYTGYTSSGFFGNAKVLNVNTGESVELLQSGVDADIKDMEQYVDENGYLTLIYDLKFDNETVDECCLPKVKLAGEYHGRSGKK